MKEIKTQKKIDTLAKDIADLNKCLRLMFEEIEELYDLIEGDTSLPERTEAIRIPMTDEMYKKIEKYSENKSNIVMGVT